MDGAMDLIKKHNLKQDTLFATGGGAYKFAKEFKDKLGVTVKKRDEMICLITGLNFILQHVHDECFYLETPQSPLTSRRITYPISKDLFPYLLVNIGSGVSFLRVDSETSFERVGGSCIGGGSFWGLSRLLTNAQTFEDAMDMCLNGNYNNVHMLVHDIYGGDYERFALPSSTVASAFGKLVMAQSPKEVSTADLNASLLHMIGANIAQLAYLTAKLQKTPRVLFAGNFLRRNLLSAGVLSYSIDFWSAGEMRALFLKHEGYFGSVGALFAE
jgi:type II pantothenate kinase